MILPQKYLDKTYGVRPAPDQDSFNNVVFSTWYHIARKEQGNFSSADFTALIKHIEMNRDIFGLYQPKHSHDNITYMLILSEVFNLNLTPRMNFFRAIWDIGIFRFWDVITYGAIFGPKLLRPLFRLFLWIPALQMIESAAKERKIRPKLIEKKKEESRFPWWFLPKKLLKTAPDKSGIVTLKEWEDYKGRKRTTRHMQNDGKHITLFRLYAFKDKFWTFKIVSKICRKIYISKFGEDYTYEVINNYFMDRNHPVIAMWKGHGDILK